MLRLIIGIIIFDIGILGAQIDTIELLSAEVVEKAIVQGYSWNAQDIDGRKYHSVTDILSQRSSIFIRNYGLSSIASASVRGGSANHFPVYWNGMPIQNPMLGQADLSLIPILGLDKIRLTQQANSAYWGSAAFGPQLHLVNSFEQDSSHAIQLIAGSFGHWQLATNHKYASRRQKFYSTFALGTAENDFWYQRKDGSQNRQTNANTNDIIFSQGAQFLTSEYSTLETHFSGRLLERFIPPTTVQNKSEAKQDDHMARALLHWQHSKNMSILSMRIGYQFEENIFIDPTIDLEANNRFHRIFSSADLGLSVGNSGKFQLRLDHETQIGVSQNYTSSNRQNVSGFGAHYNVKIDAWTFELNARQGFVDGAFIPFIPALSVEYSITPRLQVGAGLSKNYRQPTLNERFWQPGGNPDLSPESSWTAQWNVHQHFGQDVTAYLALYYTKSQNWILWSPLENGLFWGPQNIQSVESKGIEFNFNYQPKLKGLTAHLNYAYTLTHSLNSLELPKIEKFRQLNYSPKHRATAEIAYASDFSITLNLSYTSAVTTPSFNTLDDYLIGALYASSPIYKDHYSIFAQIQNIFNAQYRIIENRPMPGRFYRAGIQLNL